MSETAEAIEASTEAPFSDSLPEDLRTEPAFNDINNVQDLARSYFNAQRMVGADKIAVPGPNADVTDWSSVYDKLGRPPTSSDYSFELGKEPGSAYSPDQLDNFSKKAYEEGLSKKQAENIFSWYNTENVSARANVEKAIEERKANAEEQLHKEYGNAYDERVTLAQRVVKEFGGEDGLQLLDDTGLGNDPRVIKMFANIGLNMSEDSLSVGDGQSSFTMTPDEAKREIATLQRDNQFMLSYGNSASPTHDEAVVRMAKLFEYAHPEVLG
jgi:hypothetical protein